MSEREFLVNERWNMGSALNRSSIPVSASENAPMPGPREWSRRSTLFIHVPKTGGTTLDSIFRDHYHATPLLPSTPFNLFGKYLNKFNDPDYKYIGGHYPLSTIDSTRFDFRVTVLREPLEGISSGISYMNKSAGLPPETLTDSERSGLKALTYQKFFTTHFDTERYLIDLHYGIDKGMRNYLFDCAVGEAFENIKKFTHVFDFNNFSGEVKRFIIQQGYFPYFQIEKKRGYSYRPDHARAKPLLSEFDEHFHRLSCSLLKKVPDDIDAQYEYYRENYCRTRGLALRLHEGRRLDLRMPLGSGWHHAERSDQGHPFRWSESTGATIEIPIAAAGLYAVYLYINPADVTDLQLSVFTLLHRQEFKSRLIHEQGVWVYEILVSTRAHEWIHIGMDLQKVAGGSPSQQSIDARGLGVTLGNVYVCRHPEK